MKICFGKHLLNQNFSSKRPFSPGHHHLVLFRPWYLLWYLLIYLSRYLDQETAEGPFRSSCQAATCYYQSNHSKIQQQDTTSESAGLSSHYPFLMLNVKHGSCKYQFLSFWSDSARESNSGLSTTRRTLITRLRTGFI